MKKEEILAHCDHTLLSQTATWEEIQTICDDGIRYGTASVCIPPCYVKKAKEYVKHQLTICTVVGFPNGYHTTETKIFETKDALANGADEIDMVINIGAVKQGNYKYVQNEISALKAVCGDKVLKVIIETCLLTDSEKIQMCKIVTEAGADYIKTSTGFSTLGATATDIALMASHVGEDVRVKAAGGISDFDDAENFLKLGADRLGTSRLVKVMKNENQNGGY